MCVHMITKNSTYVPISQALTPSNTGGQSLAQKSLCLNGISFLLITLNYRNSSKINRCYVHKNKQEQVERRFVFVVISRNLFSLNYFTHVCKNTYFGLF